MKGKTWLFWGGLIAAAGGILFQTSYEVQELEEKLASVNRRIVQEQESIQVLKAEWSFLNDPTRLEQLARAHLALQPVEARQFASLDIIPMRPAPAAAPEAAPAPSFPPINPAAGIPLVRAPQPGTMPAVAGLTPAGRVPVPPAQTAKSTEKAMVVPVSAPAAAPVPNSAARSQPAPARPTAIPAATAKVPPVPAATPAAAPAGKLPANAPLPALTRPTDIAAAPIKPGSGLPAGVKPTDSLGLLVARLGANR